MNHTFMAEMRLERYLEDPDGPGVLRQARRGLREGQWGDEYVDAIGQHPMMSAESWPEEQVVAFAEVNALIMGGSVAEVLISAGGEPLRDRQRERNQALLANLPHPFTAEVDMHQHGAEGDGILRWGCPVPVTLATGLIARHADGTTHPLPIRFTIPPGSAILEIGSTLPSRTWAHLIDRGGSVARWPYGHRRIRLMVNLDETSMLSHLMAKYMGAFRAAGRIA